jgi:hypothetical protein
VALALAVFWLPVSVHCQLEQLPGLEFLSCCDHEDTTAPHQDDGCEGDACAVVEAGLYKTEERQVALPAPMIETPNGPAVSVAPITISLVPLLPDTSPPELSRFWQFSLRAALPIRAPS